MPSSLQAISFKELAFRELAFRELACRELAFKKMACREDGMALSPYGWMNRGILASRAPPFKSKNSDAPGPVCSPVIVVRVHPDIRRGLPFFGEPDHVHRRRVSRRSARPAFQRRLEFPDRRSARPAHMFERKAGLGFAAAALRPQQALPAIEALRDGRRGLRGPAISFHADRPRLGLGAIGLADRLPGFFPRTLVADLYARQPEAAYRLPRAGVHGTPSQRPLL